MIFKSPLPSAGFLAASLLSAAPLQASLVAYYPLDGNFLDSSGNGNDGTMFGGFTYTADVPASLGGGQSVSFDGASGTYGAVNTGLSLTTNNEFAISMWVRGDGTVNNVDDRIFSEGSTTNGTPLYNLGTHNNGTDARVDVYIRNGGGTQTFGHAYSNGDGFDDTWTHLLFLGGAGDRQLDLYIDGVFDTSFSYTNVPDFGASLNTTTIGGILRDTDCCNFAGSIDEVSFWDADLNQAQISALAAGTDALTVNAIPEPTSGLLTLTSLLLVFSRRR